jgi:putative ABC transport system permease protein
VKLLLRCWNRLRGSLRPGDRDGELEAEIESHIRLQTDDNRRLGMSPDDARRAAVLKFGSVASARERWHDQRVLPLLDTVPRDLRFALRGLAKEPGFTVVSVLTLALAIGANTAIFSVVNAALMRPLPYPDANQLVQVWETNPQANRWGDWASYPDFEDWRRENGVFEGMALFRLGLLRLTYGEYPEMLVGVRVSPELFSVLRANPMLGRTFLGEESRAGRTDVVVLSYGAWQRQFGSDPAVVGRTIPLDGRSHLVVGVMPPGFDFPTNLRPAAKSPDVWIPATRDHARGSHNYRVIARLKADRTIGQAQTEMDRVMRLVADLDPGHQGRGAAVAGLQQHAVTAVRPALLLLMGAILLVLLIACANVASLLLARGASRQKEIALRLALGATPTRVLQQGLTESLALALIGAGLGLLVAFGGIRVLVEFAPALPLVKNASIDSRVFIFTILAALATGVAFGLVPTLQAIKVQANDVLKETGTRQAGSAGRSRIRTVLTVAEVALALVLMIGAGLFVRSFVHLRNVDVGFDTEKLLTAFLSASPAASTDADRTVAFFQDVIARAEQVPGVQSVAGASAVPLISNESSPFRVEGAVRSPEDRDVVYAEQPKVTPAYFRAMGIRLLGGREFSRLDVPTSEPVAIVSKGLADAYWPGGDAIGKRIGIDDRQWRRVVGVVQDVRHDGLEQPARPTIYIPFAQYPRSSITLLIRSDSDLSSLTGPIRHAVKDVDRNQPLFGVQSMEQTLNASVSLRRFLMILIGIFAGIAVVLGTVGVYGVLAYFVGQRRQELAIRIALGATGSEVTWLIVRQGMLLASAGVGLGLVGSLALSRVLTGLLFGVSPIDPWTYAIAPTLLFLVVLAASSFPAAAAARFEPVAALRGE